MTPSVAHRARQWLRATWGPRSADAVRLAYRRVFVGESGRVVLDDLSALAGEGLTSFVAGDPHQTSFKEGQRQVLLHIRAMLGLKAGDVLANQEESDHD